MQTTNHDIKYNVTHSLNFGICRKQEQAEEILSKFSSLDV